jgi:hypothetical protein
VTVHVNSDFDFGGWSSDDPEFIEASNTQSFNMPEKDVEIEVVTAQIYSYTAKLYNDDMGVVDGELTGSFSSLRPAITLVAQSPNGCSFDGWYIDKTLISEATGYVFNTQKSSENIIARFMLTGLGFNTQYNREYINSYNG